MTHIKSLKSTVTDKFPCTDCLKLPICINKKVELLVIQCELVYEYIVIEEIEYKEIYSERQSKIITIPYSKVTFDKTHTDKLIAYFRSFK